jgi:antitoxin ParD1/3/4
LILLPSFGNFGSKIIEMGKNTSISLGSYFENFIISEVDSGKYNSVSEVVRAALRLLESEERKLSELRNALIEGENSQMIENFDAKKHLSDLHKRYL